MKKIFLFAFLLLGIWGCDKKYDNVVDDSTNSYQVKSLASLGTVLFSAKDSSVTASVEFSSVENVVSVSYSLYSPDNVLIEEGELYDNGKAANGDAAAGDKIFSNKFLMSQYDANGDYQLKYFVVDKDQNTKMVATQKFLYNNLQSNKAPVLSDLVMADTVIYILPNGKYDPFSFSVKATDPNGASDVANVYFTIYRPDGTVINHGGDTLIAMNDSGDLSDYGDATAGDGRYSYLMTFTENAQLGSYKYQFVAMDRYGLKSNIITHTLYLK
jgi:hypothetical protein